MNAAAIVTIVIAALAVLAIAGYLSALAVVLKGINSRLERVTEAVGAVAAATQPVDRVLSSITIKLDKTRDVLESLLAAKGVAPMPAQEPSRPDAPVHAEALSQPHAPSVSLPATWEERRAALPGEEETYEITPARPPAPAEPVGDASWGPRSHPSPAEEIAALPTEATWELRSGPPRKSSENDERYR